MPTAITLHLEAADPLFFDETWPLEELFLETLARSGQAGRSVEPEERALKPYTLSSIWRDSDQPPSPQELLDSSAYRWRICLLDDGLAPLFLAGVEGTKTFNLDRKPLTVRNVTTENASYEQIVQEAQDYAYALPNRARCLQLTFITPVILRRSGLPMPLPDPILVFRHYLDCWNTFAPRELWVNVNLLDAIEFHLALTEHQLKTRRVVSIGKRAGIGFLGRATYEAMAWRKLGAEFLGTLHTLARLAEFCGTGELTTRGLGQTRYMSGKR
jgi:CRISPR-associated endoribonuclease Cas6